MERIWGLLLIDYWRCNYDIICIRLDDAWYILDNDINSETQCGIHLICTVTNILEYISINKSSIIKGGPGWQRSWSMFSDH